MTDELSMEKRSRRSIWQEVACSRSYCEGGEIDLICVPTKECPNYPDFPTVLYRTSFESSNSTHQVYKRYFHRDVFCMPACSFASKDDRMPTIDQVLSNNKMCDWYHKHGYCPDFFPASWFCLIRFC